MFTGLIETTGRVERVSARAGAKRLAIRSDLPPASLHDGDSVAVDGVCLTITRRAGKVFEADAVAETLARTTLGELRAGSPVHLERALALGDRLGGHLVQGHVDAVAKVRSVRRRGADVRLRVEVPAALRGLVAYKGSIALQGVSLTVAAAGRGWLEVALVPTTLDKTRLGSLGKGDRLNVEVDLLARYLEALMRERGLLAKPRATRLRTR